MNKNKKVDHILHELGNEKAKEWLYNKHWVEGLTVLEIAKLIGISRKTTMYWFEKLGVKKRTISEDNKRRYKNMTQEQINQQTKKANEKTRELFKNKEYKIDKIRLMRESKEVKESVLESKVKEILIKEKIEFEQEKALGPWFVDFYLPKYNLVIECDGDYWHSLEEVIKRDKRKNHWLWRNGYKYFRLKESKIKKDAYNYFMDKFNKSVKK